MKTERELVIEWLKQNDYTTGHDDRFSDLVVELALQHTAEIHRFVTQLMKMQQQLDALRLANLTIESAIRSLGLTQQIADEMERREADLHEQTPR